MAFQVSPGVQVKEFDLTTIVPTIATTPSGFVGIFSWGPANEVVTVSTENELRERYGDPNDDNAQYWFTAGSFLRYGSNLQVVRAEGATAKNAGHGAGASAGVSSCFPLNIKLDDSETSSPFNQSGYTAYGTFVAKYPGSYGNSIGVAVWDSAATGTSGADGGTFSHWGPAGSTGTWAQYFREEPNTSQRAQDRTGISAGFNDEMHVLVFDADGKLTGTKNTVLEVYEGVSKATDAKLSDGTSNYYRTKINNTSDWILVTKAVEQGSATGLNKTIGEVYNGNSGNSFGAFFNAGSGTYEAELRNGIQLSGGTSDGEMGVTSAIDTEWTNHFDNAEERDVSFLVAGPANAAIANILVGIAERRKDCLAVLSPELADCTNTDNNTNKNNVITFRGTINPKSSYAVMDSGWKVVYDPYNDKYRYCPLNGDVAGIMVRSDQDFEPWYSPAGFSRGRLRNVVRLAWSPNKAQRDDLYVKGINPVVNFENEGIVLFGDKTMLAKPSAFDRINVRRLFNVLEKSIATAARFSLFEFNDSFTRSAFKNLVEPFLRDVQSRRGLYDFKVVCDESNNTPVVIDRNEFVADIYIKPARSINFITLNFIATPTGVDFEEIGA